MDLKYLLKVFIIAFLILSLLILVNTYRLNIDDNKRPKKLLQVVTMEAFGNSIPETDIIMNKSDAFCESHRGSSGDLDKSCEKLTKNNCNSTSCCVWTSNNKCTAGNERGPVFNTHKNGKTKSLDYYYFQNKCYGDSCPSV